MNYCIAYGLWKIIMHQRFILSAVYEKDYLRYYEAAEIF